MGGSKCSHCVAYRSTLRKLYHRWNTKRYTSPTQLTSSTSHTNFRFLDTPEKQQRYRNLKSHSNAAERKLKEAIQRLTHQQGVEIEPDMHDDLHRVMKEFDGEVRQKYPEGSFRHLFWEQQLQAIQAKKLPTSSLAPSINEMVLALEVQVLQCLSCITQYWCPDFTIIGGTRNINWGEPERAPH